MATGLTCGPSWTIIGHRPKRYDGWLYRVRDGVFVYVYLCLVCDVLLYTCSACIRGIYFIHTISYIYTCIIYLHTPMHRLYPRYAASPRGLPHRLRVPDLAL